MEGHTARSWAVYSFALVSALWLGLFVLRLYGPSDLMDNAQSRTAAYVLDVLHNGRWICPVDQTGKTTTKPPLYTWLAALATLPLGRFNHFALYLPAALATLGVSWFLLAVGSAELGRTAGLLAAFVYLVSITGAKQILLARPDALFTLTVILAAYFAYRAWTQGRGWTWFWLAAAAATLTKGPLGIIIAAGGLIAAVWERRWAIRNYVAAQMPPAGTRAPEAAVIESCSWNWRSLIPGHLPGVVLFLLLTGGWFALAYRERGPRLVDDMIAGELIDHAVRDSDGNVPGQTFYLPPLYFLSRFAPWSLVACVGFWRVWNRPAVSDSERRFERFLFCYSLFGLAIFSLAPHQRADHLFPLLPAAALLVGRELAAVVPGRRPFLLFGGLTATVLALAPLTAFYYYHVRAKDEIVRHTAAMRELAALIRRQVGNAFPLVHVESPVALQAYLNTMRPLVRHNRAARLLQRECPAFVVVGHPTLLSEEGGYPEFYDPAGQGLYVLARWPESGPASTALISNHPRLEVTRRCAAYVGDILLQLEGVRLVGTHGRQFSFETDARDGAVAIKNNSDAAKEIHVRVANTNRRVTQARFLEPRKTWRFEAPLREIANGAEGAGPGNQSESASGGSNISRRVGNAGSGGSVALIGIVGFLLGGPVLVAGRQTHRIIRFSTRW